MNMKKGIVGKMEKRILEKNGKKWVKKMVEERMKDFRRIIGKKKNEREEKKERNIIRRMKMEVKRIGKKFEEIG